MTISQPDRTRRGSAFSTHQMRIRVPSPRDPVTVVMAGSATGVVFASLCERVSRTPSTVNDRAPGRVAGSTAMSTSVSGGSGAPSAPDDHQALLRRVMTD